MEVIEKNDNSTSQRARVCMSLPTKIPHLDDKTKEFLRSGCNRGNLLQSDTMMGLFRSLLSSWRLVWLLCLCLVATIIAEDPDYVIVGVSGGLQDGFPEHERLDYKSGQDGEEVQAIFVGRGLVRGYKAFLDVMQPNWRQYEEDDTKPLINSNVFASGCREHANEYWIYLVDSRQVLTVLNNEPRFLSITPDTGLIDLTANETNKAVKDLFVSMIQQQQDKTNLQAVAIPLVTAVWFQFESHVPSPALYVHDDGTIVTNFPESLALWAGANDADRTAIADTKKECAAEHTCPSLEEATARQETFWVKVRQAIRKAEANRPTRKEAQEYGPPFECKEYVRFGVDKVTARLNMALSKAEVERQFALVAHGVDFVHGEVYDL